MRCATCSTTLLPKETRTVLCDEIQQIIWGPSGAEPEVEIAGALWLAFYCPGKCAKTGLESYLAMVDAEETTEGEKPVQACSICGKGFKTSASHHTLVISTESGDEDAPLLSDDETSYPARFCPTCMPVNKDFGRYRSD